MTAPTSGFQSLPFPRAMRTVAVVFGVIWLLTVLLQGAQIGGFTGPLGLFEPLALVPEAVLRRGFVWQLLSYGLLHDPDGLVSLVFTVLVLWFMGGTLETRWGPARVLGLMAGATLVGGVCAVLMSLVGVTNLRGVVVSPTAAMSALCAAWCALHATDRTSFFGLATLSGRQLLGLMVGIVALQFVWSRDGASVASLAGFPVGHFYASRAMPPRRSVPPRRGSGPSLRVVRGRGTDLPN